ncbi:uracil-DNA glycosylase [Zhengella mangrovi]|uniref:Type-4 uracil-DNA glycosylase n=1 Tax=Zhengella mangrovi TaxID=1982044 RepID=A0A2G1QS92_9HYPH|nr:uracil-DNA glycosylase [Zhengella mangrovi]PHP68330.1 uracil-DNA glycosylase [Zhengella mangrovi]
MTDLADLMHFYRDAGADWVLNDTPADRFAEAAALKQAQARAREAREGQDPGRARPASPAAAQGASRPAPPVPAQPGQPAAVPDEAQVARARDMARSAASLDELKTLFSGFDGCNLKFTAKSFVFGDGDPHSGLMVIGEAPGRDEDLQGLPFVGRSGQLLDRMLGAIGRDRTSAYITNVIPWRPPGNRTPTPHETEICRPFLERHIELAAPHVILALGRPSMAVLTGRNDSIMRTRGNWLVHRTPAGTEIPVLATLHPAYLLRNPAHKAFAWKDFLALKLRLREIESG